jgi:hypothetical protein
MVVISSCIYKIDYFTIEEDSDDNLKNKQDFKSKSD